MPGFLVLALPALFSLALLCAAFAALRAARRLVEPPEPRPRLHLLPGGAPRSPVHAPTRPASGRVALRIHRV